MAVACATANLLAQRALGVDLVMLVEGEEEAGSGKRRIRGDCQAAQGTLFMVRPSSVLVYFCRRPSDPLTRFLSGMSWCCILLWHLICWQQLHVDGRGHTVYYIWFARRDPL